MKDSWQLAVDSWPKGSANRQLSTANFTPAWFLRGPHAQTIWGRIARPRQLVRMRREVLVTPDDDDLVLDQLRNGQEVTVGLLATNGRGEQSNEADAKFAVRLGAGQ